MKVDMSPKAVAVRLKRASQLRRLCLALGKAKPAENTSCEVYTPLTLVAAQVFPLPLPTLV
jgi:hypothetical protein